jgi:uncharacterized protein (DUF736 family)
MEKKNNSGAIFKNKRKEKDTHPDYRGNVVVNGKEMEVVMWVKESKSGEKFFSVAFSEPYIAPEKMESKPFINDDLPF